MPFKIFKIVMLNSHSEEWQNKNDLILFTSREARNIFDLNFRCLHFIRCGFRSFLRKAKKKKDQKRILKKFLITQNPFILCHFNAL